LTWFTSDTHFGHKRILEYCASTRQYETIEEHDAALVRAWNARVKPTDHVYHLGDFAFLPKDPAQDILRQLNGYIHLIEGNHDRLDKFEGVNNIVEITPYKELKVGKKTFVLFHFPIESWNKVHYGSIHLHGHSHGSITHHPIDPKARRMDVGVDCHKDNAPFTVEEILRHVGDR
jgi:calcineurin-like phosphoesterase family protein